MGIILSKLSGLKTPKDTRSSGEVTFNYTSFNGRFIIGDDDWSFETDWSQSGENSAHFYNDPQGISGIAIAEGVSQIEHVTPEVVAAADFSSRSRTVRVGQIALLKNTAGYFAAIAPISIKYSDVPSENIMTMRFAIQTDKSSNFSQFTEAGNEHQALVDQLLLATDRVEKAINAIDVSDDNGNNFIGIGHNQPPAEFALTEQDRTEVLAALASVRKEAPSPNPSASKLRSAGATLAIAVKKIAIWAGDKANTYFEEFAKEAGKETGKAVGKAIGTAFKVTLGAGVIAALKLQIDISALLDLLKSFLG